MNRSELNTKLIALLPSLDHDISVGENPSFPDFDLMPFDYLEYAQSEVAKDTVESRINCVGHLKRAIDCELDTFFHILGLYPLIQKRNLKFEKKTDLVRAMGLVSPRSLAKLNQIRNKLEHDYSSPDPEALDLYFDLCSAFVSLVEGYIFMFCFHAHMDWSSFDRRGSSLEIKYDTKETKLTYTIRDKAEQSTYVFTPEALEDFAWGMRLFFQLCRATSLISIDRIVDDLKKEGAFQGTSLGDAPSTS